jgi:ABC-type tungstate transport system permease subunit
MRILMLMLLFVLFWSPVVAETHLRLATTTSTENSGLLSILLPPFETEAGCKVDVIAVGTGHAPPVCRQHISEALEHVGLSGYAQRDARELSS